MSEPTGDQILRRANSLIGLNLGTLGAVSVSIYGSQRYGSCAKTLYNQTLFLLFALEPYTRLREAYEVSTAYLILLTAFLAFSSPFPKAVWIMTSSTQMNVSSLSTVGSSVTFYFFPPVFFFWYHYLRYHQM